MKQELHHQQLQREQYKRQQAKDQSQRIQNRQQQEIDKSDQALNAKRQFRSQILHQNQQRYFEKNLIPLIHLYLTREQAAMAQEDDRFRYKHNQYAQHSHDRIQARRSEEQKVTQHAVCSH